MHAEPVHRRHWWESRGFVLLAALTAVVPLLFPAIPPISDLPGHMGRYSIELSEGQSWYANWYAFHWSLIGNLGVDLLILPMSRLFGLEFGVKLIVLTIPALTVAGLLWTAREAHGKIPPTAALALPLAYNYPFHFGFVNYTLAMALALNGFALWLRLGRAGRFGWRAALFVPLSCLLWVCHVFGWATLGVLALAAELVRRWGDGDRRWSGVLRAASGCLSLTPPLAAMIAWRSKAPGGAETGGWFDLINKLGDLSLILRDRWFLWDLAATILLYLILFRGVRDRTMDFSPVAATAAALLAVVFLLLPRVLLGSAYADMRLAPFALAMALIAMRPRGCTPRREAMIAMLALTFFLARTAGTTVSYALYDRNYTRALAALDHVPVGARVLGLVGRTCDSGWMATRLDHLPAMAIVRRHAFSNDQWSIAGAQLMRPRYAAAGWFAQDPSEVVTVARCPREQFLPIAMALRLFPREAFDYVWLIDPPRYDPRLLHGMAPIWRDGSDRLLRIDR